jgi:hypothetical protein
MWQTRALHIPGNSVLQDLSSEHTGKQHGAEEHQLYSAWTYHGAMLYQLNLNVGRLQVTPIKNNSWALVAHTCNPSFLGN